MPTGGNVFSQRVEWKAAGDDLSALEGKTIALQFEMRSAELFSFRFD